MSSTSSLALITPAWLLRSLRKNPIILQALLKDVSPDQATKSPGVAGEWSILEVLYHLRDSEAIALQRVRLLLQEEQPILPSSRESAALARKDQDRQQDFTSTCTALFAMRQSLLDILDGLDEEEWMRKGVFNGTMLITVKEVALQAIMHDIDHTEQITHLFVH